jgi:proline racemase
MNDSTLQRLREALSLMVSDPAAAADLLEGMAAKLMEHARALRAVVARGGNPLSSPGGMGDSARMQVYGPDGKLRSTHDTKNEHG